MKQILMATDFSEASVQAADLATAIAERHGAKLTLAHAYDSAPMGPLVTYPAAAWSGVELGKELRRDAEAALAIAKERAAKTCEVEARLVEHPHAAHAIADLAETEEPDLIVVGSHGRTGITRFLIGSVAEKLLRHATRPVLVARGKDHADPFPRRMLVCTDFSETAAAALSTSPLLSRVSGADVHLTHVVDPNVGRLDSAARALIEGEIREQLTLLNKVHFGGEAKLEILGGSNAADAITKLAADRVADLVVLATHGRTGVSRMLLGSVAERVTRHASCSVLVAR